MDTLETYQATLVVRAQRGKLLFRVSSGHGLSGVPSESWAQNLMVAEMLLLR
jgi:hypothetical protein